MKLHLKLGVDGIHYDARKCYSYNQFMNIVIGARGLGKTTGFLIQALKNYVKTGEQFIYLRRYKPEMREFLNMGTMQSIVDGLNYKGGGSSSLVMSYENDVVGYGMLLSTAVKEKSIQVPRVSTIIFDEVVLAKGSPYRYLQDEVPAFLNFCSTIFRTRENTKVIVLGNNDDMFNPYLEYFSIPEFKEIFIDKDRGIFVQYSKPSKELLQLEQKTGLFKLTKDTAFGRYHYENELFTTNKGILVKDKPLGASQYIKIIMNRRTLYVYKWYPNGTLNLWCTSKEGIVDDNTTYPLMNEGKINYYFVNLVKKKFSPLFKQLYYTDKIQFQNGRARDEFLWILDNVK